MQKIVFDYEKKALIIINNQQHNTALGEQGV